MKNSAIQWTDHTFNPWEGCTKVAPECKNCYAEVLVDHRFGRAKWGKGQPRRRTSEALWKQPLAWNKEFICNTCGSLHGSLFALGMECAVCAKGKLRRHRVFCLSLGDWLDNEVPIEWLADLLARIDETRNLVWQLLTKRPQNWAPRLNAVIDWYSKQPEPIKAGYGTTFGFCYDWLAGKFPENVWVGVSAGADQRAALEIPAKIHFLSCEPMLHEFDPIHAAGFDWIIFGGESGKHARPCYLNWIRDGIRFCRENNIRVFVKQVGANPTYFCTQCGSAISHRACGPTHAMLNAEIIRITDSHGGDWNEWPADLRVREFPA